MASTLRKFVREYVEFEMKSQQKFSNWGRSTDTITEDICVFAEQIENISGIGLRARTMAISMVEDVARFEGNEMLSRASVWARGHAAAIQLLKAQGVREAKQIFSEEAEIMRLLAERNIVTNENRTSIQTMVNGVLGMYDTGLRRSGFRDGRDTSVRLGEIGE